MEWRWGWDELITAAAGAGARIGGDARRVHRLELLCALGLVQGELGRRLTANEWGYGTDWHVISALISPPTR
jgi:hypothetical protein